MELTSVSMILKPAHWRTRWYDFALFGSILLGWTQGSHQGMHAKPF